MWLRHLCSRGLALASVLLAVVSAVHGHAQVAPGGARTGAGGMVFDFLEHDYNAEGKLAGHCMPGGTPLNATTCTKGEIKVNWGETALQWFIDHPKRQGD